MSKPWVIIGIVAGVLFVSCAGVCGTFGYLTWNAASVAVKPANEFLTLLGDGKIDEAYDSASTGLQNEQTREAFAEDVKQLGLTDYDSSSWNNRRVNNNESTLDGTATTKKGRTITLKMKLVKESGVWKVRSVADPSAVARAAKTVPPDDKVRQLVASTTADFGKAVKAKDFTEFRGKTSTLFQREATAEKLNDVFKEFIDKQIDVPALIEGLAPVFDQPPAVDASEKLVLTGYYPSKPNRVKFELKYVYEHPEWKLSGIRMAVGD